MKMEDANLVRAIEQHESTSTAWSQLDAERKEALDYYLGEPMGNEVDGRSQVIARQVWDTVEWLKPQLADIFTSGEEIVSFSPRGPEDVKPAEQETDYVNHLITQKNNWFEIWYNWTHDALIEKVGYVKAYWDDEEDLTVEKYQRLTQEEYAQLQMHADIEIGEQQVEIDPATMQPVISCEVRRKKPRNTVKIENLPPENVRVSQMARGLSLQDPRLQFVEHVEKKTLSDLRDEGFDVADDINDQGSNREGWDDRDELTPFRDADGNESDPSMRMVWVREVWIRVDFDGDGRAELRHVILVGTTVLLNEDADIVPIVALCPTPLSHQHAGLSVADAVMDLQRIQTMLLRGAIDNQALANNGRYGINENNVNLDDMLESRPGSLVRVNGSPSENLFPLTHPTTGNIAVPMMEYVDKISARRTGISEQSQGLNPDALNNQAGRQANNTFQTAALQRIKFIARVFAETGIKSLFQLVHQLTLQNSRQQEIVELRGEWVPVDPRQWSKRTDMVISVALGAGDRPQQMEVLSAVRQMQLEMLPLGLAKPQHLHATMTRFMRAAGFKDASEFWADPTREPPPPPQPPLEIQLEQMKQQGEAQKLQAEQANDQHKFQAEMQLKGQAEILQSQAKQRETQMQLELQAANDERDRMRQAETDARAHQLEMERLAVERYLKELEIASRERIAAEDRQVELMKAEAQRQTALDTATMSAQTTRDAAAMSAQQKDKATEAKDAKAAPKADSGNKDVLTAIQKLAENLSRPRKIKRGPDGKIESVE